MPALIDLKGFPFELFLCTFSIPSLRKTVAAILPFPCCLSLWSWRKVSLMRDMRYGMFFIMASHFHIQKVHPFPVTVRPRTIKKFLRAVSGYGSLSHSQGAVSHSR